MRPSRFAAAAALLLTVVSTAGRAAEPPVRITHQGRILNAESQPATGAHTLKFTLYHYLSPPTSGTGLTDETFWTDTYDVTLSEGVYGLVLGEGGKAGTPITAAMFADERFLGINLDGLDLSPRMRIGTAPFAANAQTAQTAQLAQNIVKGGVTLFDDAGHFKGPTDNLDVAKLGGKVAGDFALVAHNHDDVYLKAAVAATTYATKTELANVGDTLSTTYYTKTAADDRFALKTALDPLATKAELVDYIKKTDAATKAELADYLKKSEAAATYAPKTGAMPSGAMVLSENAADPGLVAAGMKLYGSLSSGWAGKPGSPAGTSHMDRAVELGGKLYFIGGHIGAPGRGCANSYGNTNRNMIFDIASNSWSEGANMITARHAHTMLTSGGKIYAIGGYGCGAYSAVNEVYNPANNTWAGASQPPGGHAHHWGAFEEVGGKFYLIGGCADASTNGCKTPQTHVYDPTNDTWASRTPYPHPIYAPAHAAINGKIYVAAGYNHDVNVGTTDTYEYNPSGDSWRKLAAYPGNLTWHAAAVAIAGKLHLFGGHGGAPEPQQSHHWVYDPATDTWSKAEPVGWSAYAMTAVAVGTRAFVLGGWPANGVVLNNFAEYNAGLFIYRKD